MSPQPLDELYFRWLYSQVADDDDIDPSRSYLTIMRLMYSTEFVWFVPNDDNRIEDGKALRLEFFDCEGIRNIDRDWLKLGCSFLEMVMGLSRRLAFAADGEASTWFWHLVKNVGIFYNDRNRFREADVLTRIDNVIQRNYQPNGEGGLFPLEYSDRDQTKVELWYQMSDYLIERS